MAEALRKCAVSKSGCTSTQLFVIEFGKVGPARMLSVQSISSRGLMREARMLGADALGQIADHLMIVAAFARRLDQLAAEHDVLVAAALIDVVMLEEHGGGQHDVGEFRRLGHELLMHADEQIFARQALLHFGLVGRDRGRIGVLHDHRLDRRAAGEIVRDRSAVPGRCGSDR